MRIEFHVIEKTEYFLSTKVVETLGNAPSKKT